MAGATVIVVDPGSGVGTSVTLGGIQVYDKAGNRLGAVTYFSPRQPPSRGVNFRGAFGFAIPRQRADPNTGILWDNPEITLFPDDVQVKGDRLIVIGDSTRPTDPWGGVVTNVEYTDGSVIVTCADVGDLLSTPVLPQDSQTRATQSIVIPDGTPAANVVSLVMGHANNWFAANGEVLWGVDTAGSGTFFGHETLGGDILSVLDMLVERAFGEWAWRIELTATTMRPVIMWRDEFLSGTGPDLIDGPGGNIAAGPSLSVDTTTIVNAIRLTGSVTRIESLIPEGARALPVAELIPVAEVWLPTQGYRRRFSESGAGILMYVDVPFSIEEDTQAQLATEQDAKMRALFASFIHGFHAQYRRPWHDGWAWAGLVGDNSTTDLTHPGTLDTDADFERLLTADRYIHYSALASGGPNGDPITIVMKPSGYSPLVSSYVKVTYDRLTGKQEVWTSTAPNEVPPETVFPFEWRRYLGGEYDPRSQGVGESSSYTSVRGGAVTSGTWHVVPYGLGDKSGSTSLAAGVDATTPYLPVVSMMALPSNFPYQLTVGHDENVLALSADFNRLFVYRGYGGTTASPHESGESVEYIVDESTVDDTAVPEPDIPPQEVPWPAGVAYASRLLAKLSRPKRTFSVHLANVGGAWSEVGIGTQHSIAIANEGPSGGITGTIRVTGIAPDYAAATMELVVEDVW